MDDYLSKSDIVTAALRELIIKGELSSGEALRQRDLAERFGVSPTPVREALRRLEAEGLVDYDVHRGSTVVEADLEAVEENYRIRAALEALAVELAVDKVTEATLDELEDLNTRIESCPPDSPEVADLNRKLHFSIYQAARSPLLVSLMRLLWQSFPQGPQAGRPREESVAEHREIIQALRERDGAKAALLTHDHILGGAGYLRSASTKPRAATQLST